MSGSPALTLAWLAGRFAVWRAMPADDRLTMVLRRLAEQHGASTTAHAGGGASPPRPTTPFISVTTTTDEISIVCEERLVPAGARVERGFAALRVVGTLDMGLVGILGSIAGPLADAGIPIFAVSTFDTDYVLVRAAFVEAATAALRAAGHRVENVGG